MGRLIHALGQSSGLSAYELAAADPSKAANTAAGSAGEGANPNGVFTTRKQIDRESGQIF
jgi:hypothetical protein